MTNPSRRKPCKLNHPKDDRIFVGNRERCRLCYEADCVRRTEKAKSAKSPEQRSRSHLEMIAEFAETREKLDRAIRMECAMPWERHPVDPDPRDCRPW